MSRASVSIMQIVVAWFLFFRNGTLIIFTQKFSLSWCHIRHYRNAPITHIDQGLIDSIFCNELDSESTPLQIEIDGLPGFWRGSIVAAFFISASPSLKTFSGVLPLYVSPLIRSFSVLFEKDDDPVCRRTLCHCR